MSSIMWSYHSHVSEVMDIYSGLVGPMVIYKPGMLGSNGLPTDIDREYVLYLLVGDENQSRYLEHNINAYCGVPSSVDTSDDDFIESNLMHGINGLLYCNLNDLFMCDGETVRWYTFAFGTEVDLHTRKSPFPLPSDFSMKKKTSLSPQFTGMPTPSSWMDTGLTSKSSSPPP